MKRRSVVLGLSALAMAAASPFTIAGTQRHLRILVLGGRRFLGPAIVTRFKARGHTVTLFNRGLTNPELFPELELLRGDRDVPGGLAALEGTRTWDAVVDVWPFEL